MKTILIPFNARKSLALGSKEGFRIEGPILYFPEKGAIFYKTSITGDAEGMGFVTVGVKYFEDSRLFLRQLERQLKGETDLGLWQGEKFDLSKNLVEVDISTEDFDKIAANAKQSYKLRDTYIKDSMRLIINLEGTIGMDKIGYGK